MKVLLLGATGMLGRDLAAAAPSGITLAGPGEPRVDVTDADAIARAIDAAEPAWVVNAAAYTRVDGAEHEPERASAVNGAAVGSLGRLCAARGVRVLQVSSDYVFDGRGNRALREDDPTSPIGRYGESKLLGERLLLGSGARSLIVRTQWLFGPHGRSFPRTMWERAAAGRPTRVVADQRGRPTSTADLARALWQLIALDAEGVLHAANDGEASWYELARAVFESAGCPDLVSACATTDYPTPARRPAYSVLDTTRLEARLGAPLPHWRDALARFLGQLRGATATAQT